MCTDPAEWAGGLGRRSGGARAVGLCGRSHAWGPWAWAVRRDERTQAGVVLRAGSRRAGRRLASCWAQASVVLGAGWRRAGRRLASCWAQASFVLGAG